MEETTTQPDVNAAPEAEEVVTAAAETAVAEPAAEETAPEAAAPEADDAAVAEDETADAEAAAPDSLGDLKRKTKISGKVVRTELYGAFIDIGIGTDAIIHISQLGSGRVNRVSDVLKVGDEVEAWVDKIDAERQQVILTLVEPLAVEWEDLAVGQTYTGTVVRLENFGAFVNIGAEKEGLVHVSEISHDYIKHPSEKVTVGDEIQVQVLGHSKRKRRINLSMKALLEKPESAYTPADIVEAYEEDEEDLGDMPTAMEIALRAAMGEEPAPRGGKRRGKKGRGKKNRTAQQEELLSRTLQYSK